jgi:hypothetical protein
MYFTTRIIDMQKILQSKVVCPSGQDRVWHEQVLRFMQRQYMDRTIPVSPNQPGRTELSEEISRSYGYAAGTSAAERIRMQESLWV